MFDFGLGTSELLVIAVVALIVVGPKELPTLLRAVGRMVGKVKALAAEFQGHLDDLARESGVEDVKKKVEEEMEELSIEDLDREFTEIEREMREQLAAGAKPLDMAEEAADEDLTDDTERPLPETLDLDAEPDEAGEDGEVETPPMPSTPEQAETAPDPAAASTESATEPSSVEPAPRKTPAAAGE